MRFDTYYQSILIFSIYMFSPYRGYGHLKSFNLPPAGSVINGALIP
jgi:hypothetical protein